MSVIVYLSNLSSFNQNKNSEKDINEVLQSDSVYLNVSRGIFASADDLFLAFGTSDTLSVCKTILDRGDLQVSDKERAQQLQSMFKEISSLVSSLTINRDTKKPFPLSLIEEEMRQLHFSVKVRKSAKQQALEVIKQLAQSGQLPIERVKMRVRIEARARDVKITLRPFYQKHQLSPQDERFVQDDYSAVCPTLAL